jgi:hypothetical protein
MGAVNALDCGQGGGVAGLAGSTRIMTTMTRKRTSALSPTAAAAAATAIARCFTAGGVAMTTGGPGDDDGDVEAPAVRVGLLMTHSRTRIICSGILQNPESGQNPERRTYETWYSVPCVMNIH